MVLIHASIYFSMVLLWLMFPNPIMPTSFSCQWVLNHQILVMYNEHKRHAYLMRKNTSHKPKYAYTEKQNTCMRSLALACIYIEALYMHIDIFLPVKTNATFATET